MIKDITYMHEHMTIDLSKEKHNIDCKLDLYEETKNELLALKKLGVTRIVDVTNIGMGRNIEYVENLEKETGIKIYSSTGYYKEPFLSEEVKELSVEKLAEKMIEEITVGIENTNRKATFIGEIGTGFEEVTPLEKKVFIASAMAQKQTGTVITTHTSLGKLGHEQLDILESNGADLRKVILGHTALSNDLKYIKSLLERGVYITFDTVGKISYLPEQTRYEFIKELCDEGWKKRLLLSVDLTRRSHLKVNGGIGYSYLLEDFVPHLIKMGVAEEKLIQIMVNNPKKILGLS